MTARKPRPKGSPLDEGEIARACELYRRGLALWRIAAAVGRCEDAVRRLLARECGRPARAAASSAARESYPANPAAEVEARIQRYRDRAGKKLPLFEAPREDPVRSPRRGRWRRALRCFLLHGRPADSRSDEGENR